MERRNRKERRNRQFEISNFKFALFVFLVFVAAAFSRAGETVTFNRDIAPLVFARCATCHHAGEAAPFNLLSYEDVHRHARQIVDVTQKRFMPPWLPTEGEFLGDRRLSESELKAIKSWVDAGMPRGEPGDFPPPPTFTQGWQTGTPDMVLESPPYSLSAQKDRDVFRNFVVPIKLDSARWVQSIELRPTNPKVTHHARLGVDSTNESIRRDAADPEPGYAGMAWAQDPEGQLVIWAPGMLVTPASQGIAWRLYPRTALVLHTHMQPSGKPEVVQFRIGIHFAKSPPERNPVLLRIGGTNIDIPAGEAQKIVTDTYTLPIDVDAHTIFPHAHSLCRELHVVAEKCDGSRQPLISIDHFDENWHDSYRYKNPVRLPKGTKLVSTFFYDNTNENIRNRNHPARRVVYGSNVTDEMADVYLQVTATREDQRAALLESYKRYEMQAQITGFGKSLEMYADNPWLLEGLATCYVGTGEMPRAIATLEQRLKTGPREVFPVTSLGMALLAKGDVARAEEQLRSAIAMDGEYPLAWFGLGKALVADSHPEEAEKAYRRSIELAPGMLEADLNLADVLIRRDELDEAARICLAAVDDAPDQASLFLKLAEIRARQKNYDQALEYYTLARKAAPYTHPPKVLLAVYCINNGEGERGVKLLQEARSEFPDHPMPPLMLGQLALRQQQPQAAKDYLAAAASLRVPDNWPESHRQRFAVSLQTERFRLAQQLQDINLARDALSKWLKLDPANPKLKEMAEQLGVTAAP